MRPQRFMANLCLALPLIVATVRPAAAQDKEPTYRGRTVSQWAARVGSKEADVSERAVRAITKMGPEAKSAAPALLAIIKLYAFGYADVQERCKPALAALKGIGPEAVPAIREALKGGADPRDFNRINFVSYVSQVLGEIGPGAKAAIPDLVVKLKDKELFYSPAKALQKIGPAAIPALVAALKDKQSEVGARIALTGMAEQRSEIGPDAKSAVPALMELLQDKERTESHLAAELLGRIGPEAKEAVPSLIDALKSGFLRQSAARALGRIGPAAKEALPSLTDLLKDKDVSMRIVAAEAVLRLAPSHPEASAVLEDAGKVAKWKATVETALHELEFARKAPVTNADLLKALNDEKNRDSRQSKMQFLLKRGVRSPEMVPALIQRLGSEENGPPERRVAIAALVDIGVPAVPALLKALKDNQFAGRNKVPVVLGAIDPSPRTVALLLDALKDKSNHYNDFPVGLIRGLAEIGPDAKEAVPVLLEILRRKKGDRTSWPNEVAKALGELGAGDKKVLAALAETLKDEYTVVEALRGLVLLGPSSVPTLLDALRNKDYPYRNYVVDSLGELGKAALPALIEALKDNDLTVRVDVINTLGRMGADAKPAVQALIDISKKDTTCFFAVNGALKQIDPEAWKKAGFK